MMVMMVHLVAMVMWQAGKIEDGDADAVVRSLKLKVPLTRRNRNDAKGDGRRWVAKSPLSAKLSWVIEL